MKLNSRYRIFILFALLFLAAVIIFALKYYNMLPSKTYTAADFSIETLHSDIDFNGNGIDDYTDILYGARKDAENHPVYDGAYCEGGYPPDDRGVCTDVIWRAFKNAGYKLKDMVDADIAEHPECYPHIEKADSNIDFRRVKNLHIFFRRYGKELTLDTSDISAWQPGDIVIFRQDKHIGIVSDKRNKKGQPYIIHNGGQPEREEDYLKRDTVTAHFRFTGYR